MVELCKIMHDGVEKVERESFFSVSHNTIKLLSGVFGTEERRCFLPHCLTVELIATGCSDFH